MNSKRKKADNKKTDILSYILLTYVFLMLCIYPLYFENGYYNIGVAKNHFFIIVSIIMMSIILIALGIRVLVFISNRRKVTTFRKISVTGKFLYMYMAAIFLSFLFSEYKENVFWGANGWYLGTLPLLLLSGFAVLLMYKWENSLGILYGCLVSSGLVFWLGICNRFSFYPIPMKPENPGFISTLGNINWFCGYMSVVAPIGIGLWVLLENDEYDYVWKKWLLTFYVWITFLAGFCQGSESVFLWTGILFFVLLWIAVKKMYWLKNWLFLTGLWGMAGQTVRLLRILLPGKYSYGQAMLIDTNITLWIAIVAFLLYVVLHRTVRENIKIPAVIQKGIHILLISIASILVLFWIALSVYNTKIGVSFLENVSLFVFDENWGNGRGAIYKTAFEILKGMTPVQILFGVGADGFSSYAYSIPELKEYLTGFFGKSTLTNAHCEIVTNLINLGLLGTISFYAMTISLFFRCMKAGKNRKIIYLCALSIACYLGNNIISFAQILNIPFLFLIMGIGENYLNRNEEIVA